MALPRSVLLIISGSVSAYKALELIRLLRARDVAVHTILTRGGAKFVTPLAVSSLTGTRTYDDLFSLTDEVEMGHIQLSRVADVVLVAPASADLLAKMAHGIADDLATTALLATNKPVIVAPAMNHKMWHHPATQRNLALLRADGVQVIDPTEGDMACGEFGIGRLAEPANIVAFLNSSPQWGEVGREDEMELDPPSFTAAPTPTLPHRGRELAGRHAIVTSGPTFEPIDPVRFIGNRSSGKQGHAIAAALIAAGARVTLVSGPTQQAAPVGAKLISVTTGKEMLAAVEAALPADIFIGAAAVADWRPSVVAEQKIKKQSLLDTLSLDFIPTDDILATVAQHPTQRPALVVGFAAETEDLATNAQAKLARKGCDWIVANDVRAGVFGADENTATLYSPLGKTEWPRMSKRALAAQLVEEIDRHFTPHHPKLVKTRKG